MIAKRFLDLFVDPGLHFLSVQIALPVDDKARVMLLAIAGVETQWSARLQQANGPARSFWQFESEGLAGVFSHPAAGPKIQAVCAALCIPANAQMAFTALAWNDHLAVAAARLLLWSDPRPLPLPGDERGGWEYYQRNWRPGKPSPERWSTAYAEAIAAAVTVTP